MKLYTQNECEFCAQVQIPEGMNIDVVNIHEEGYNGFIPPNLPVIQHAGLNFEGPQVINILLNLVNDYKG